MAPYPYSCFELGDLVLHYESYRPWLSVICPDFGSSSNYTEVKEDYTRLYHVQRLGSCVELEHAWIPQSELKKIDPENVWGAIPLNMWKQKLLPESQRGKCCEIVQANDDF